MRAPVDADTNSSSSSVPPYSCSLMRISSPGPSGSERSTPFSAEVAFNARAMSSVDAPT
jgi:hypothetical protein